MKLKGAKAVHYDSGPNMTPLVDVVMVILIFLMLAGSFGGVTHYLESNLPIGSGPAKGPPAPGEVKDEQLLVRIDPDLTYGFKVVAGDIARVGDTASLYDAFIQKRNQYEAAGTKPENIQIILLPAPGIRYEYVARVYEAALRAKFQKVAFQASS